MSKEETLTKRKMSTKKVIFIILSVVLIISIITGIALYREHKLRRAVVSVEGLTFDTMNFKRINDCKEFEELSRTDNIICKTTKGDWIIWSVEGYEESLEYVYANCFMDGYYYEMIK